MDSAGSNADLPDKFALVRLQAEFRSDGPLIAEEMLRAHLDDEGEQVVDDGVQELVAHLAPGQVRHALQLVVQVQLHTEALFSPLLSHECVVVNLDVGAGGLCSSTYILGTAVHRAFY